MTVVTVEDEVCTPSFDAIKSLLSNENVTDTTKTFLNCSKSCHKLLHINTCMKTVQLAEWTSVVWWRTISNFYDQLNSKMCFSGQTVFKPKNFLTCFGKYEKLSGTDKIFEVAIFLEPQVVKKYHERRTLYLF